MIIMSCLGTDPVMSNFLEFTSRLRVEMKYAVCNIFYKEIYKVLSSSGLLASSISGRLTFQSRDCIILTFGILTLIMPLLLQTREDQTRHCLDLPPSSAALIFWSQILCVSEKRKLSGRSGGSHYNGSWGFCMRYLCPGQSRQKTFFVVYSILGYFQSPSLAAVWPPSSREEKWPGFPAFPPGHKLWPTVCLNQPCCD